MEADWEAAHLLTLQAAWMADNGKPNSLEASMAKAKAGRVGSDITLSCVELAGSVGYSEAELLEKWARDSKILDIFEGTQQIQQLIVARRILGLVERRAEVAVSGRSLRGGSGCLGRPQAGRRRLGCRSVAVGAPPAGCLRVPVRWRSPAAGGAVARRRGLPSSAGAFFAAFFAAPSWPAPSWRPSSSPARPSWRAGRFFAGARITGSAGSTGRESSLAAAARGPSR